MRRFATEAAIAAGVSALLYVAAFALGLGFLFLFVPTLPIFWLGLARHDSTCLHASLMATVAIALFMGAGNAIFYLVFLALPSCYVSYEALKQGQFSKNITLWYPLSMTFTKLVAAIVFILLAVTLFYMPTSGGLPALLASQVERSLGDALKDLPQQEAIVLKTLAEQFSFLIIAIAGWMWATSLYMHGWIINHELKRRSKNIRPDFAVSIFPPPNWLISLLLITAIASIIGGESLAFWGKSSLILLTLPHFLFGMALVHEQSKKWPARSGVLFFIYFMIFALLWVAIIIAAYGFYYHLKLLNKYLSSGGDSFRS